MDVEFVRIGDGGAGDEGIGIFSLGSPVVSSAACSAAPAWAKSRDSEEGPAAALEFTRGVEGNNREVGGRVTVKVSSTSASGGPGAAESPVWLAVGALRSGVNLLLVNLFCG